MNEATALMQTVAGGSRNREAVSELARVSDGIIAALRRAVPFLAKPGMTVSYDGTAALPLANALSKFEGPRYVIPFACSRGGSQGSLSFDKNAISVLMDGAFGGTGKTPASLEGERLSSAQNAFMSRMSGSILTTIGEVLDTQLGIRVVAKHGDKVTMNAVPLVSTFRIGAQEHLGSILLALATDAVYVPQDTAIVVEEIGDQSIPNLISEVMVDLVVELGRLKTPLRRLEELQIGDILSVDTRVSGPVTVCSDGRPLFHGHPTSDAGRISIRLSELEQ